MNAVQKKALLKQKKKTSPEITQASFLISQQDGVSFKNNGEFIRQPGAIHEQSQQVCIL